MLRKAALIAIALIACVMFLKGHKGVAAEQGKVTLANGKTVSWPPEKGKPYPEIELVDRTGKIVKLADFKGKVIIVEPVGMTCPACNAFSGGAEKGGFKNTSVQGGLDSVEKFLPQHTGVSLHDKRIVFVQLLLYNLQMQGPTQEDAQLWAEHFGMDKHENTYVLAGGPELIGQGSYNMIPGFQLIDKDFVLRSDATGDNPKESIWDSLLPMVPKVLREMDNAPQ
ncbi:MAG: peroxiredoxin family protein [Alphaproteobacteria bacterium]